MARPLFRGENHFSKVDDMRCLGEIEGRRNTEVFVAYLLTQDISAQIENLDVDSDRWEIWIRNEDQISVARNLLADFVRSPGDAKYAKALDEANKLINEKEKRRQQAAKNVRRMDVRSVRTGMAGPIPPLTLTLLILCIAVFVLTDFGTPSPSNQWAVSIMNQLGFVDPVDFENSNGDAAASLKKGELWRLVTPIFVHLNIMHIAFNMFMLLSFGRMVERWLGTPAFAMFVLLLAVAPNLLQAFAPPLLGGTPAFGGISGVLYGLFGYVWLRSTINPTLGVNIPMPIAFIFILIMVLGLSGVLSSLRHYAHLCHLGGLLIGSAFGYLTERQKK